MKGPRSRSLASMGPGIPTETRERSSVPFLVLSAILALARRHQYMRRKGPTHRSPLTSHLSPGVVSIVSAITATPRHPGRFDIAVDGRSLATLSLEAIERLGLAVGVSIAGLEERIGHEAAALRVYDRALGLLAFRGRASRELARSLVQKGEPPELVNWAIVRLTEQGLLDDAAFAESFTRARVLGAQQSKRRVQQDLARKGVAREVCDAAIATVFREEEVDQRDLVERAARKKLAALRKLEPVVRRRRLYGFLARRGYDGDDIRQAMEAVGEELRADDVAEK
jgi:regulatory protein